MTAALWRRAALLSSALLLSAGWYVAARTSVDRALERGEAEGLERSMRGFQAIMGVQKRRLRAEAELVAADSIVRTLFARGNPSPRMLNTVLVSSEKRLGAALLLLASPSGTVLGTGEDEALEGADLSGSSLISGAATSTGAFSVWGVGHRLVVVTSRAITEGDLPIAVVVLGLALDDALLAAFEASTGTQVALSLGGEILASSAPPAEGAFRRLASAEAGLDRVIEERGQRFLGRAEPLDGGALPARALFLRPLEAGRSREKLSVLLMAPLILVAALGVLSLALAAAPAGGRAS